MLDMTRGHGRVLRGGNGTGGRVSEGCVSALSVCAGRNTLGDTWGGQLIPAPVGVCLLPGRGLLSVFDICA